jgi:hypothetical protein
MAASRGSTTDALASLKSVKAAAIDLTQKLDDTLAEIINNNEQATPTSASDQTTTSPPTDTPDALQAAHDAAALIKAHSTKISLLIINEPFTPPAVIKVVTELIGLPVPAITNAAQTCDSRQYTSIIRRALASRTSKILKQLGELLKLIPLDGKALVVDKKENGQAPTLAVTGVLWSHCDEMVKFANLRGGKFFIRQVRDLRETLNDNYEELKEWSEEEPDEDDDEEEDDPSGVGEITNDLSSTHVSAQAALDELMAAPRPIPTADTARIRPRLDACLKRVKLTTHLFTSIVKRRLETLPAFPISNSEITSRLDEMLPLLRAIPDRYEDLTAAFYEQAPERIDALMDQTYLDAFTATELLLRPWREEDGKSDAFTEWGLKFQKQLKVVTAPE